MSRSSPIAAARLSTPTGPPSNLCRIASEQLAVHQVEADRVDVEHSQRRVRHLRGDVAVGFDLGEIAHAPQQPVVRYRGVPRERFAISATPIRMNLAHSAATPSA